MALAPDTAILHTAGQLGLARKLIIGHDINQTTKRRANFLDRPRLKTLYKKLVRSLKSLNRSDLQKEKRNAQGISKKVILAAKPNVFRLALNTASIWPGCHQASNPYCQVPAGSIEELLPSVLLIASTSIPAILLLRLSSVMRFTQVCPAMWFQFS